MPTNNNIIPPQPNSTLFIPDSQVISPGWQAWFNSVVNAPSKIAASATPTFTNITSGTNTTAVMLVGTGAKIAPTGSGIIAATTAPASGITGGAGITEVTSDVLTFSPSASAAFLASLTVTVKKASAIQDGYLYAPDWVTFNAKQPAIGSITVPSHNFLNSWNGTTFGYAQPAFNDLSGFIQASQLIAPTASTLGSVYSNAGTTHNWVSSINTDGSVTLTQPAFTDISGTVGAGQLPAPTTSTFGGFKDFNAVSHKWAASSSSGVVTLTQPAFTDLSGSIAATQLIAPTASTLGGVLSQTAVTNNFLTGISLTGAPTYAQPSFSNLSGSASNAQMPSPTLSALGGIQAINAVSHQWINAISTSGVPSLTQPAFSDLSGSIAASQIPAPTTSTFGGFKDFNAVSHQFAVSSSSGVVSLAQPAFTDISGTLGASQLPAPTTSTFGGFKDFAAVSNSFAVSSSSGVVTLAQPSFSNLSGSIAASQIPAPTTSTFGGFKDFNAVSHKFAVSSSSGVVSLAQPAFSDISGTIANTQFAAASTWTPTLAASGSMTYTSTSVTYATYWTIGNLTWISLQFTGTIGGTVNSNGITFTLPVAPINIGGNTAVSCFFNGAGAGASGWIPAYGIIQSGGGTVGGCGMPNGANNAAGTLSVQISGCYRTS